MAKGTGGLGGLFGGALALGIVLHQLHEAVDGFEWAISICPWCRLRGQQA